MKAVGKNGKDVAPILLKKAFPHLDDKTFGELLELVTTRAKIRDEEGKKKEEGKEKPLSFLPLSSQNNTPLNNNNKKKNKPKQ